VYRYAVLLVFCFLVTPIYAELSLFRFGYNIVDVTQLDPQNSEEGLSFQKFSFSPYETTGNIQSVIQTEVENPTQLSDMTLYTFITSYFYCYPNPFRKTEGTVIGYSLPSDSDITLKIYNSFGHLIFQNEYASGQEGGKGIPRYNRIHFNENSIRPNALSAGTYFAFLLSGDGNVIGKTKLAVLP